MDSQPLATGHEKLSDASDSALILQFGKAASLKAAADVEVSSQAKI